MNKIVELTHLYNEEDRIGENITFTTDGIYKLICKEQSLSFRLPNEDGTLYSYDRIVCLLTLLETVKNSISSYYIPSSEECASQWEDYEPYHEYMWVIVDKHTGEKSAFIELDYQTLLRQKLEAVIGETMYIEMKYLYVDDYGCSYVRSDITYPVIKPAVTAQKTTVNEPEYVVVANPIPVPQYYFPMKKSNRKPSSRKFGWF